MKAYDLSFKTANPDAKPKRVPPVRKWTEEDKAFTKAKNAYLKVEKAKLSDSLTVAEMKKQVKALGDAYTKAHKKPKSEESEEQSEPEQQPDYEEQDDSEEELVVEEQDDSEEELVADSEVETKPKVTDAKLDKQAEKARKQAKKEENERRRAAKAAKKAGSV